MSLFVLCALQVLLGLILNGDVLNVKELQEAAQLVLTKHLNALNALPDLPLTLRDEPADEISPKKLLLMRSMLQL